MPPLGMKEIAERFAPVFAQKIDKEWPAADQIAPMDFSGPLTEVKQNVPKLFDMSRDAIIEGPKVYYSAVETATHVFVTYAVYHIFDWWKHDRPDNLYDLIRDRFDEHAHDLEGALFVVRKEPEPILDAVVTVSHLDFYLYTEPKVPTPEGGSKPPDGPPSMNVLKFNQSVDGNIWLDSATSRVKLYIQAKGHGIRGDHSKWGGGESIWYYKHLNAPGSPVPRKQLEDEHTKVVDYQLEDIFAEGGLWDHRYKVATFMPRTKGGGWGFTCFEKLTKGADRPSAANPPWSWNDHNDDSPIGEMATDPARFITRYAQGWGPVSLQYVHNRYLAI